MQQTENCCIHYKSIKDDSNVVQLSSKTSWDTILNAATLRKFEPILLLSGNVDENSFPNISYHKACKTMFTLKRDLDKLGNENDIMEISSSSTPNEVDNETNKKIQTRSKDPLLSQQRQRCDILPTVCIFCEKVTKISLLNDTFIDPFSKSDLVSISSGISIPPEFVDEIMSAKMIGTGLMEQFIRERLVEESNISLFDKIKKRNIFS